MNFNIYFKLILFLFFPEVIHVLADNCKMRPLCSNCTKNVASENKILIQGICTKLFPSFSNEYCVITRFVFNMIFPFFTYKSMLDEMGRHVKIPDTFWQGYDYSYYNEKEFNKLKFTKYRYVIFYLFNDENADYKLGILNNYFLRFKNVTLVDVSPVFNCWSSNIDLKHMRSFKDIIQINAHRIYENCLSLDLDVLFERNIHLIVCEQVVKFLFNDDFNIKYSPIFCNVGFKSKGRSVMYDCFLTLGVKKIIRELKFNDSIDQINFDTPLNLNNSVNSGYNCLTHYIKSCPENNFTRLDVVGKYWNWDIDSESKLNFKDLYKDFIDCP
ncbi:hypothetical protein ApNV_067 [Aratus pisonii nudivirus]|nr:hypothetical protein ApNV_067 [Aratus pisonii nudivirus]